MRVSSCPVSFNFIQYTKGCPVGDGTSCFPQLAPAKGSSVQDGFLELPLRIATSHRLTLAKPERTSDRLKQIPAFPSPKVASKAVPVCSLPAKGLQMCLLSGCCGCFGACNVEAGKCKESPA